MGTATLRWRDPSETPRVTIEPRYSFVTRECGTAVPAVFFLVLPMRFSSMYLVYPLNRASERMFSCCSRWHGDHTTYPNTAGTAVPHSFRQLDVKKQPKYDFCNL